MDPLAESTEHDNDLALRRQAITDAIERHDEDLVAAARVFAFNFDLPSPAESVTDVAEDLFQAAVVRALEIAEDFDPARSPRPWLMGLLLNVAKEERRRRYRDRRRTSSLPSTAQRKRGADAAGELSEQDLLGRLRKRHDDTDPGADINLEELLSLVSVSEQEVLRLSIVEDLSGREVAARLGITEGAANVRLHRALGRLRKAYDKWDEPTKRV